MAAETTPWAPCECGDAPDEHRAVVVKPICIDPGTRVLFEGTLGGCLRPGCDCDMYSQAVEVRRG